MALFHPRFRKTSVASMAKGLNRTPTQGPLPYRGFDDADEDGYEDGYDEQDPDEPTAVHDDGPDDAEPTRVLGDR